MAGNGNRFPGELVQKALDLSEKVGNKKAAEELGISAIQIANLRYNWKKRLASMNKEKPTTEDKPNIKFKLPEIDETPFKRGKIYYISRTGSVGSEMKKNRPAVIVSNDDINKKLGVVEVVFLTTAQKSVVPEHVVIQSSGTSAITICEQITTIDKSKIREYIGECTEEEMKLIDKALLASLKLENYIAEPISDSLQVVKIKAERDTYKELYDKLLNKYMEEIVSKK